MIYIYENLYTYTVTKLVYSLRKCLLMALWNVKPPFLWKGPRESVTHSIFKVENFDLK